MGRRLQQLVQTIASEADMEWQGFTLCIQSHIWLKLTAVAYHDVYDRAYLSTTHNVLGIYCFKTVVYSKFIIALNESAFY